MIDSIESALTYLSGDMERDRGSLTSREHRLVRQAQMILDGEMDVPRSYGSKTRRGDQQRSAQRQRQSRSALGIEV